MGAPLITCHDIEEYTDLAKDTFHCFYCGDNGLDDCRSWEVPNQHGVLVDVCCKFIGHAEAITPEIAEDIYHQRGYR